jgi:hypothetical protein
VRDATQRRTGAAGEGAHGNVPDGAVGKDNSEIQIKVLLPGERSVMGVRNGAALRIRGVVFNQRNPGWSAGALISRSLRAVLGKSRKRRLGERSPDGPRLLHNPSRAFASMLPQWNWKQLSTPPAECRRITIWLPA